MTSNDLRRFVLDLGAAIVGFAKVGDLLPEEWKALPFSITIARRLNPEIVKGIKEGPTLEYFGEYLRVNADLARWGRRTADYLQRAGYRARDLPPTEAGVDDNLSTRFPHKTAATRAGIGWIGKSALLVTPEYGPAIRLTTVLTDRPLDPGIPIEESRCKGCALCVEACPAGALTGGEWRAGSAREDLCDAFACERKAKELSARKGIASTICGICVAACPFTHRAGMAEGVHAC